MFQKQKETNERNLKLMTELNNSRMAEQKRSNQLLAKELEDARKSKGGGGCFSSDTMVMTENGFIHMSHVQIGMDVKTCDENGKMKFEKVLAVCRHENQSCIRMRKLEASSWSITLTGNHLIYIRSNGIISFIRSSNVVLGDEIFVYNGISFVWKAIDYISSVKRKPMTLITKSGVIVANSILSSVHTDSQWLGQIVSLPLYLLSRINNKLLAKDSYADQCVQFYADKLDPVISKLL